MTTLTNLMIVLFTYAITDLIKKRAIGVEGYERLCRMYEVQHKDNLNERLLEVFDEEWESIDASEKTYKKMSNIFIGTLLVLIILQALWMIFSPVLQIAN